MKCRIEFLGDVYEDKDDLKVICNGFDLYHSYQEIRSRLAYRFNNEDITEDEEKFIERLLLETECPGVQ